MRISDWSSDVCSSDLVGVQCLLQRNSALGRSRRRINARLDLAHQRLRPIAGLAQTDPVASVNLYADGADVPPVPAHVPLDGIGLCGGVADHHQPLHLLVAMNTRSHGKLTRSEEHTSELQSLMRISYAVFCLQNKKQNINTI